MPGPMSFDSWLERLRGLDNPGKKIGLLVTAFKATHPTAPPEDGRNTGGRIAGILKHQNPEHAVVLKAIWDSSSNKAILGSHLTYIQGMLKGKNGYSLFSNQPKTPGIIEGFQAPRINDL